MIDIYSSMEQRLQAGESVVIATVINTQGSTPRKAGARMAIFGDGSNIGSIGGGSVEAAVEKLAAELLPRGGALFKDFCLDNRQAADLGMICGGEQQILLAVVQATKENRSAIKRLASSDGSREKLHLVTQLKGSGPDFSHVRLRLYNSDGQAFGDDYAQEGESSVLEFFGKHEFGVLETLGDSSYFLETTDDRNSMYIFGAGHVARPTVATAAMVGFQTVVLDDRSEFANSVSFPQADQIVILPGFEDPFAGLTVDETSSIVIVTRGHSHDQSVLVEALGTSASYIGMIGSRHKVRSCFDSLKLQGWDDDALARVHAPIGIEIGSETPEEIAVSIVAELIQVRSELRKKKKTMSVA